MPVGIAFRGEARRDHGSNTNAEAGAGVEHPHHKLEFAQLVELVEAEMLAPMTIASEYASISVLTWRTAAGAASMHSFPGTRQLATLGIARR